MVIIQNPVDKQEVAIHAENTFGDFVKAVVDIKKEIMAVGGELHADEEALLLESGSEQNDLWGINIYVDLPEEKMLEFDSMINIRPKQNNRSRGVENEAIREKIIAVVNNLIKK
ncbi:TPA: hypothetical protein DCZ32_04035 [Candidatus Uhrbacteria bacterium]|nr:hypothetical protein [Candidatus Uhrbacteria bacterium]